MRLFVRNLPRLANQQALRSWFSRAGFNVTQVELVRDLPADSQQGAGYVVIEDPDRARNALRYLNGRFFWHRVLELREAE